MSERQEERAPSELWIVGVGASAGGLEALQQLFEKVPTDIGMAFVVVQHLSPDFKSMMPELLSRHTSLAVRLAETGTAVVPNTIYLIPPRKEMIIQGGVLHLKDRESGDGPFLPIDTFLTSLAQDQGPKAAAVILSGSGSDGARGIRAIHEAGGLVIAQDEASAKFTGMPRSAAESGVVDAVRPPGEIADVLRRFAGDPRAPLDAQKPSEPMERLLELLRSHTGIDFSSYKASTVIRRIDRRLRITHSATLADYLEHAAREPEEVNALYQDLLIGVTSFFRDEEAFARIERDVMPTLVRALPANEELRIWVAACANGAEAYSLAIVALEAFEAAGRRPEFRVFATDVHRASLDFAGAGVYGSEELRGLSDARRERFFQLVGHGWQVQSELRSHVVFAQHNVLRDAPFTRLDLIACRNLLIYFKAPAQRRALSLFHFGLKPQGVLVLGSSETPGELEDEFLPIDTRWKLYKKRRDARLQVPIPMIEAGSHASPVTNRRARARDAADQLAARAHAAIARRYGPPALVLDADLRVLLSLNGAGKYLAPRDGALSASALDLVHGELRFVLASAVRRAMSDGAVAYHRVRVEGDELLNISVTPIEVPDADNPVYTVCLEPERRPSSETHSATDMNDVARQRVEELELDLKYARENLQATIEEMEASNEELQATNEELVAANEELQSTNEELHSVNEELYTVNAEHQAKIAELTEMTSDMDSLLESTQVHTIFLDSKLRIRKFTPRMAQTFKLLPSDVGRRINDFAHDLNRAELMDDVERVCASGVAIEAEVKDRRDREYLLRVLPYRTAGQTDGVVVTLIDIASLKQAQRDLERSERRYRTLVRAAGASVFTTDGQGHFVEEQPEWTALTGQSFEDARGEGWQSAIHPQDRGGISAQLKEAREHEKALEARARIRHANGEWRRCALRLSPVSEAGRRAGEWVGYVADEHEHEEARAHLEAVTLRLREIFEHSPVPIYVKDRSGRYEIASRSCAEMLGVGAEDVVGKTDFDFLPVEMAEELRRSDVEVLTSRAEISREERVRVGSSVRTFLASKFPLRDPSGEIVAIGGIWVDVTERQVATQQIREAMRRRDEFLAMLSHELRNPMSSLVSAFYLMQDAKSPHAVSAQRVARRQLSLISRLLDDLLDVARLTRGEMEIRREPAKLDEVVRDAVDSMQADAQARGVGLTLDIAPEGYDVLGDAARLQQVCVNLLTNALRFSPSGGRVRVVLERSAMHAVLEVRDEGEGIPSEELERIFELFYQRNPGIARSRGGLGVGLSLVKQIVERHGGTVTATSPGPGRGATIRVTIPIDAAAAPVRTPRVAERDRRLKIVVIEDNEDARDMLRACLEQHGHAVDEAPDGESGVELIRARQPDLALVDVGLPGLDGYGVARRVREQVGRGALLIALTGYGREEDRRAATAAGFDAHLTKPVDPETLMRVLHGLSAANEREAKAD